jgi:hypothetical protein
MTMEGSSGPAAPGVPGGGSSNFSSGPSTVGNPLGGTTQPTAIGHVVVSEVYYQADAQHGGATADEWIEIYNGTSATVDLSHWTVRTAASSQTIQNGTTLGPSQYLVLAGTTNVRAIWTIPSSAQVIAFTSPFPGFSATGDAVILQNSSGSNVDAVSWGTNVSAFSPSVPTVALGHSIVRKTLSVDTDSASDWIDTSAPTPGR